MGGFRPDVGPNDRPGVIGDLSGGLDTLTPAHKVAPGTSPDLLNVVLREGAVQKRGGFVPICRETPKISSLRNVGVEAKGRIYAASGTNTTYRTVVGACHAGHRPCWDDAEIRNGLTLDFFCSIDDLTTSHGGNGAPGATTPFGPSPYTVKVRPILSKGPIKRWSDIVQLGAQHTTNDIAWKTTTRWGPTGAGNHAMPFAVFLWNNAGTWEISFAYHYWDSGLAMWQLRWLKTDIAAIGGVRLHTLYQITCGYDIANDVAFLRVGARFDTGSPEYVTVSGVAGSNATAMPAMTPTPVQVFDCPQELIEAPTLASATQPPGLGLGGAADGGYWFASLRFEGQIEDVVIYRGLVPNASSGALDRTGRIDPNDPPAERLQHWPIDGDSDDVIEERAGVGNHLYRAPAGPIFDSVSPSPYKGTLAFNGTTSYALLEISPSGDYSWRTSSDGVFRKTAFANAMSIGNFGIEVVCWPESIETNFEQVVAEIHTVLRLAIDVDGKFRVYVRNNVVTGNATTYQTAGVSTQRVVPGQRYHVIATVDGDGTNVSLIINGVRDVATALATYNGTNAPSGITIGMGMFRSTAIMTAGVLQAYTAGNDQINTDGRSGFFGRVESFRVLVGDYPFETPVAGYGGEVPSQHQLWDPKPYEVENGKHFEFPPIGARTTTVPISDDADPLPNITTGHAMTAAQYLAATGESQVSGISTAGAAVYTILSVPPLASQSVYRILARLRIRKALAAWDFTYPIDAPYHGGYSGVETSTPTSTSTVPNPEKLVWVQRGYVQDLFNVLGDAQLRCVESDPMKEFESTGTWSFAYQRRFKPYLHMSPRALAPRWEQGMVRSVLGHNAIAMLASWTEESTGETFQFARSRRSLYWVKRPWRRGSPFRDETDAEGLWFFGQRNDACRAASMTSHGTGTTWAAHSAFVDMWIRPLRLDGKRLLACYGDNIGSTIRYMLYLDQGTLYVLGQNTGGGTWRYFHGALNAGAQEIRQCSIGDNHWHHLHVAIGNSTVAVHIDGQIVTMTASPAGAGIAAANIPASTNLWIGGMDADQMAFNNATAALQMLLQPFCGIITDVRERSAEDQTWWDAGESGVAPQARAVPDGSTRWMYAASSDTGWSVPTAVVGVPNLEIKIRELVGIKHDLDDALKIPVNAAVFRNSLVFTQRVGFPQRVTFRGLYNALGPFQCTRLGMEAPGLQESHYYGRGSVLVSQDDATGTTFVPADATYSVYVSFVNGLGEESEAELIGTGTADLVNSYSVLDVWDVPRSSDEQVVARNIYLGIGGANPIFVGTLYDNSTFFYEIQNRGLAIAAPTAGLFLPAPVARRVTVGQGAVILTTLDGNPNSFAASGQSPGQFPLTRQVPVDSDGGEAVIAAISYLGTTFIFKRDGTWSFSAISLQDIAYAAGLRPVNSSAAAAGGAAIYDNVVYGASRRGVWMFDGSNYAYASKQLEGEYPEVDVSADGLLAQQGVFFETESQYLLSVRLRGESHNHRVYAMDVGRARSWTKLDVPDHVCMVGYDDPVTSRRKVAIGTINGLILEFDPSATIDGIRDIDHHLGAQVVSGTPSSSTSTTLTIGAGAFDVAYDGLRGRVLQFLDQNGELLATREIVSNTATILTWDEPFTVPAGATFHVGGYTAYWSSGWVAPQNYGNFLRLEAIDLGFEPAATNLLVEHHTAMTLPTSQTFDPTNAELQLVDMTLGYQAQPLAARVNRHGRYVRFRVSTHGSRSPFSLTDYGLRFGDAGTRGKPS